MPDYRFTLGVVTSLTLILFPLLFPLLSHSSQSPEPSWMELTRGLPDSAPEITPEPRRTRPSSPIPDPVPRGPAVRSSQIDARREEGWQRFGQAGRYYQQARAWMYSDNPRGRGFTKEAMPMKNGRGDYRVLVCAGAGCPMKIPFAFSRSDLEEVRKIAARTREHRGCRDDSARCELIGAQEAVRQMEMIVVDQKLRRMSDAEQERVYGDRLPTLMGRERNKQLDLDCVDQSANGISYLMILKDLGLLRHHEVMSPGYMLPSHWFTRVEASDGARYRFDLYHRGRHGVLPGILRL